MNGPVRSRESASVGLIAIGASILGIAILVSLLLFLGDSQPRGADATLLTLVLWVAGGAGACVLLVGLIAKGVALGIHEANQRR